MKKPDQDKIAQLEQAIQRKYGDKTVQHPRSDWTDEKEKDYLEQIKKAEKKRKKSSEKTEKIEQDGFLLSKKLLKRDSSDRKCPVCKVYSFDLKDDLYMNKYECCWSCYIQYVDGREERWKTGWRPNSENHKEKT